MIIATDHGPVRELRLERPPANALTPELIDALREAVTRAPDEGVRALVISGTPGRFSGGLDVPVLIGYGQPAMAEVWRGFYAMMRALVASPIPIAAAITGHSPAGGAVISICCDTRFMAEGNFVIGLNEVQVGIPIPPIIHALVSRIVGPRQAERMCTEGLLLPAAEAARIGLVDELVPADRVVQRAVEWCQGLLALPPGAMSSTRRHVRAELVALFDGGMEEERDRVIESWFDPETQQVLRAVVERLTKKKG